MSFLERAKANAAIVDEPTNLIAEFDRLTTSFVLAADAETHDEVDADKSGVDGDANDELRRAIADAVVSHNAEACWRIECREDIGRHLVASCALQAGTIIFQERPLIAVEPLAASGPLRGEMAAVALELLKLPRGSPARLLQEPTYAESAEGESATSLREWTADFIDALRSRKESVLDANGAPVALTFETVRWALGVATVNSHGAWEPTRGVLGILASMMEHSCTPSCTMLVGTAEQGSILSLKTLDDVAQGESLTISYVPREDPLSERRSTLLLQHGFVCECQRCRIENAMHRNGHRRSS